MHKKVLISLALAFSAALPLAVAQERVKKKTSADFESVYKELGVAWKAGQYGKSMGLTRELMTLVSAKRTEMILAAMPGAPAGWTIKPQKKDNTAGNPFAGAMAASVGSITTQEYRQDGARGTLELTVTADSPLVQMFKMWAANPKMLGPDAEHIKYTGYDAVLKKEGNRWSLQILIDDNLCEAKLQGEDDEFLLRFMSQETIDKIARALNA